MQQNQLIVKTYRSPNVPDIMGFPAYVAEVSKSFCPYIEPSAAKSCMHYTVISSEIADILAAERTVFASGYALTELLRQQRVVQGEIRPPLLCENLVFLLPKLESIDKNSFLAWPHWVLKNRYTVTGILFGKFKKGDSETAKDGRKLPIPPCHLLSIRESIPPKDPQFFEKAAWLKPALETAQDIGQDVFDDLSSQFPEIGELRDIHNTQPEKERFQALVEVITDSGFYEEAKESAERSLQQNR